MVLNIEADFSLEETARILGQILEVPLELDDSGYYEEFPAYSGVARNAWFALLGEPASKHKPVVPWHHYQLLAGSIRKNGRDNGDILIYIHSQIVSDGRLQSLLM